MIRLIFRNLFQSKTKLLLSIGGTALALLLIISLNAIFDGVEKQVANYIDHSGADVFISQSGVYNLHMSTSSIPLVLQDQVVEVDGVKSITPLIYLTNVIKIGEERNLAYIFGLPEQAASGGPWQIFSGTSQIKKGEAVIDRQVAEKSGVKVGDYVNILSRSLKLVGLSEGTSTLVNSIAFISMQDFQELRNDTQIVSFFLVQAKEGVSEQELSLRIAQHVDNVTVQTRSEFASQEREVVRDMSIEVIAIMNSIGYLIGLAVLALSIYIAVYSRRKEFGILKAIGASNRYLYQVVLGQAVLSVIFAFLTAVILIEILSLAAVKIGLSMELIISPASLGSVLVISLVLACLSAILPIRQVSNLDPAMVFRGK